MILDFFFQFYGILDFSGFMSGKFWGILWCVENLGDVCHFWHIKNLLESFLSWIGEIFAFKSLTNVWTERKGCENYSFSKDIPIGRCFRPLIAKKINFCTIPTYFKVNKSLFRINETLKNHPQRKHQKKFFRKSLSILSHISAEKINWIMINLDEKLLFLHLL